MSKKHVHSRKREEGGRQCADRPTTNWQCAYSAYVPVVVRMSYIIRVGVYEEGVGRSLFDVIADRTC